MGGREMGAGKGDVNTRETAMTLAQQVQESKGIQFGILQILDTPSVLPPWSPELPGPAAFRVEVKNLRKIESEPLVVSGVQGLGT